MHRRILCRLLVLLLLQCIKFRLQHLRLVHRGGAHLRARPGLRRRLPGPRDREGRVGVAARPRRRQRHGARVRDLSLTVSLRNRNWAMRAEPAAPLDAELFFAGRRLEGARLVDAGMRIDPQHTEEFRMLAVSSSPVGFELGSDAVAEFAKETVAGVVEFELRLTGAFKYRPVHVGGSREAGREVSAEVARGATALARVARDALHVDGVRQSQHHVLLATWLN